MGQRRRASICTFCHLIVWTIRAVPSSQRPRLSSRALAFSPWFCLIRGIKVETATLANSTGYRLAILMPSARARRVMLNTTPPERRTFVCSRCPTREIARGDAGLPWRCKCRPGRGIPAMRGREPSSPRLQAVELASIISTAWRQGPRPGPLSGSSCIVHIRRHADQNRGKRAGGARRGAVVQTCGAT